MIICEGEKNIHQLVRHYLRILHRTYLQLATLAILADKLNFHLCLLSIGQNSSGLLQDLACGSDLISQCLFIPVTTVTHDRVHPGIAIGYTGWVSFRDGVLRDKPVQGRSELLICE